MPVNVLEQLLGGVVTPSVIIDLLPGHEGYAVSLSNRGGGCVSNEAVRYSVASRVNNVESNIINSWLHSYMVYSGLLILWICFITNFKGIYDMYVYVCVRTRHEVTHFINKLTNTELLNYQQLTI